MLIYAVEIDCDFEDDLCSWSNAVDDDFDWTRNKGATESFLTGPNGDHTMRVYDVEEDKYSTGTGYYVYIETNGPRKEGDIAILQSKQVQWHNDDIMCLTFW